MFGKLCLVYCIVLTLLSPSWETSHHGSRILWNFSSSSEQLTSVKTLEDEPCTSRMEIDFEKIMVFIKDHLGYTNMECSLSLDNELLEEWKNCISPIQLKPDQLDRDGTYHFMLKMDEGNEDWSVTWKLRYGMWKESLRYPNKWKQRTFIEFGGQDKDSDSLECCYDAMDWLPCTSHQPPRFLSGDNHDLQIRFKEKDKGDLLELETWKTLESRLNVRPLMNLQSVSERLDPSLTTRRLLSGDSSENEDDFRNWFDENIVEALLVGLAILLLVFFICLGLYWCYTQSRRIQNSSQRRHADGESQLTSLESGVLSGGVDISGVSTIMAASWPENLRRFRYEDLWAATGGFPEDGVLGEGGFGKVYSGTLTDGRSVAVKKLESNGQQGDREFFVEVATLCRARHHNILNLLGVCIEDGNRVCVFELMDWGSVRFLLDNGDARLGWKERLKVALGVARGLACLHESLDPPIVHRDLKSENILMDKDGEARISDFGLCTLAHHEARQSHLRRNFTMTVGTIRGTFGYLAPEVANSGKVSTKSDVYAFGVVLLELLTGRHPIETGRPSEEQDLVKWIMKKIDDMDTLMEAVDPLLAEKVSFVQITAFVELATSCLNYSPSRRPSAVEVSVCLEQLISFKEKSDSRLPEKIDLCIDSKLSETSGTIPTAVPLMNSFASEGDTTSHGITPRTTRSSSIGLDMEMAAMLQYQQRRGVSTTVNTISRQEDEGIFSPSSRRELSTNNVAGPSDDLSPS